MGCLTAAKHHNITPRLPLHEACAGTTQNDLLSVLDSDDFVAALKRMDRRPTMRLVQIG
jgi:hypothetical protein